MAGFRLAAALAVLAGPAAANAPPAADVSLRFPDVAALSQKEFAAATLVLAFSVLCFVVAVALKRLAAFSDENVIRILALVLIVTGTLFLVTLGYSAEQIAPALGILGTIAGYMLGRADRGGPKE